MTDGDVEILTYGEVKKIVVHQDKPAASAKHHPHLQPQEDHPPQQDSSDLPSVVHAAAPSECPAAAADSSEEGVDKGENILAAAEFADESSVDCGLVVADGGGDIIAPQQQKGEEDLVV